MRLLCRGWWLKDRLQNLAAFTLSCYLKTIWFPQDAWGVRVVRDVCKIVPTINHRISACWRDRILYGTVPLCSNTAAPAVLCASTSVFSLQSTRALLALKKKTKKKTSVTWLQSRRVGSCTDLTLCRSGGVASQSPLYIKRLILTLPVTLPQFRHTATSETKPKLTCRVTPG